MRLDRFLQNTGCGSRKEVKQLIKKKRVTVNGVLAQSPEQAVEETSDTICFDGEVVEYVRFRYWVMNKPAGYVCATRDKRDATVLEVMSERDRLFYPLPVGRLDKDTTGLLLMTTDGQYVHELASPRKHVWKTYLAQVEGTLAADAVKRFEEGLRDGEDTYLPAELVVKGDKAFVTICEGRFHQVKRMLHAVGVEVVALHRLSVGAFVLPDDLEVGDYRPLTEEERALTMERDAKISIGGAL